MEYLNTYKAWLESPAIDEITREELLKIKDDEKEIKERFYKDLEFGTGGIRGIMGAGTNRMNIYTVRKATQGLANFINSLEKAYADAGVAIAYDSRNNSKLFATEAARVLAGNGIKVYLYDDLRPTPMLSFAVRECKATAGIVITASHNPKEYNGYKVYWSDGGQMPPKEADEVLEEINRVNIFDGVKVADENHPLINIIGNEIDDKFLENVLKQSINKDLVEKIADDFKIVYTPIHGSGNIPVRRILSLLGLKNVYVVKEQELPDGNFPTVPYPNPEERKCFDIAIEYAKKYDANLIIGTDPDCDRVGICVKNNEGEFVTLSGNETGVILLNYIISQKLKNNTMPKNPVAIKTIVTTEMARAVAESYGIEIIDVLTGFKFIGEKIKEFEQSGKNSYLFGFEESYGYLAGTYARDKDAVVASMLIAEVAAYYASKNMTIYDGMCELYKKYGYYVNTLKSLTLKGVEGMEKISKIMNTLRTSAPKVIGNAKVVEVFDYKLGEKINLVTGKNDVINLPKSDVLSFVLEDGAKVIVRPSGTEPKIKMYLSLKGETKETAEKSVKQLENYVMDIIGSI